MSRFAASTIAAVSAVMALAAPHALAGEQTDALSRCLVQSTTAADREDLVRWIFAAASAHPAVNSVVTVDEDQRAGASRTVAELFVRLLAEDCRGEAKAAIESEGKGTIEASFQALGELAGEELFQNRRVGEVVSQLEGFIDHRRLEQAFGPGG